MTRGLSNIQTILSGTGKLLIYAMLKRKGTTNADKPKPGLHQARVPL
jgi:hypothetical protein